MDGAKEQVIGIFRRKCQEAGIWVKQTKLYTPWSNAAEAEIRKLKKGAGQHMVRSKAPKRLWDNCLERVAYARSLTAHAINRLNRQVPETPLSGETADIAPFAEFKWYKWVLFQYTSVTYPDDTMVLGCALGPAIDIVPAMIMVLKANGKVVFRSTLRPLSPDKMANETMKEREKFNASIERLLGDLFKYEDFAKDPELESLGTSLFELLRA